MPADFVVEDGTGKTDANAFETVEEAQTYWDARGRDYSCYSDPQIQQAIVRATQYLSESFQWKGYRTKVRDYDEPEKEQALSWPRIGVTDGEGILVPDDIIPRALKWATSEIAFYELTHPDAFDPVFEQNRIVDSERVGPLSVSYNTDKVSVQGARPQLPTVSDLLAEYLALGGNNSLFGQAVRI